MSVIAIGMNLMLAGLLAAALMMGFRLNGRLKHLRDSHDGFARAVAELDVAAARAEQGLADLRAATDEAADTLADRIEKARALSTRLDRQLQGAPQVVASSPPRSAREPLTGRGEVEVSETDVERVTHKLGELLSTARAPRIRPEPERFARAETITTRQRPRFEDDLFEGPPERLSARGARR